MIFSEIPSFFFNSLCVAFALQSQWYMLHIQFLIFHPFDRNETKRNDFLFSLLIACKLRGNSVTQWPRIHEAKKAKKNAISFSRYSLLALHCEFVSTYWRQILLLGRQNYNLFMAAKHAAAAAAVAACSMQVPKQKCDWRRLTNIRVKKMSKTMIDCNVSWQNVWCVQAI